MSKPTKQTKSEPTSPPAGTSPNSSKSTIGDWLSSLAALPGLWLSWRRQKAAKRNARRLKPGPNKERNQRIFAGGAAWKAWCAEVRS